ncbi:helix-turn-helix domain-containing protein [Mucilaginibacter sp.]|jgi:AraC-like DNA-binding protein|uniref:helix-turn-helix domain-containing protein n=1 Tax=Mucilaginibacter sp. TaxID=1882438 RepID=UPI0035615C6A
MRRLKQFEPLVIHDFEERIFHMESHAHTYFEIGYIYKGSGIHHLNNNSIKYRSGDVFLICPEDTHTFDIRTSTRFVFIKFTDSYFELEGKICPESGPLYEPTKLMRNQLLKEKKLQLSYPNTLILKNIIDIIVVYKDLPNISYSHIIFHQVISLLGLIKESLNKFDTNYSLRDSGQEQLISYVHDHIYKPELIQIRNIAKHFRIAPSYFSAYFKRKFGMGYSEYVNQYRAKLIETRMLSKQYTLKQITEEFGFTDESHLSRFFKKHHQVSPGSYQKTVTSSK